MERRRNESRVELDKEAKAQFSMKKPKYSVIHWILDNNEEQVREKLVEFCTKILNKQSQDHNLLV